MSISSQIERISTAKTNLKNVANKYLPNTINNETISAYNSKIETVINKYRDNCNTSTVTNGTCTNALDVPVKNYKVYGNSTQNGTPTPTNPIEITSVGDLVTSGEHTGKYKIPMVQSGKNLYVPKTSGYVLQGITFTPVFENGLLQYINVNGTATGNVAFESQKTYMDKNTDYRLSGCPSGGSSSTYYFYNYLYDENNNYVGGSSDYGSGTPINNSRVDYAKFGIYIVTGTTCNNMKFYPQLEKGTSVTAYEPHREPVTTDIYLDEPLRGISTTKDYIDFATGKRHNLIGNIVLNGSENWSNQSTYCCKLTVNDLKPSGSFVATTPINAISNYLQPKNWYYLNTQGSNAEQCISTHDSANILYIRIPEIASDFNALKTWLSTHNTEVSYELATPTEENITLPIINFFDGTNIITIGTGVQATQEIVYITKGGI